MKSNSKRYIAAIDAGSNAVRMTVGRMEEDGRLQIVGRWRAYIQLGREVFQKGTISESSLSQLENIFKKMIDELSLYPNVEIHGVATSAMREASRPANSVVKWKPMGPSHHHRGCCCDWHRYASDYFYNNYTMPCRTHD